MNAEIVTTGTELLLGEIVDTNAAHIARQLREVGVNLFYKTTVGDNQGRLAEVLRLGLSRSDVILVTGGLGPTVDDITREAVAEATDRPLELRPDLAEHIRTLFAGWGRQLTDNNLRQAYLPQGARALPNPIGTAPGFVVEHQGRAILAMPGVPREMKRMMADQVLPFLQARLGDAQGVIVTRILHVAGLGESLIDDRIGHLMTAGNPTVGLAAHLGQVDIRIAARAPSAAQAQALIAPVEAEIRQKVAAYLYGVDGETLGGAIAALLRQQAATLAVVETNTAGRIAAAIPEPDRSLLVASLVAGDLPHLERQLALPIAAAIDEATARLAAQRLREISGANFALALLGDPGSGQDFWSADRGHSWLALAGPAGIVCERFNAGGADDFTAQWLSIYSLTFLRRQLATG
ncbi:MAG: CinA family nicotinamide mononucleotide deamidase-related protein [Caldilineales bacterium]|nr:CinA family nicotinamide mononucleotide deamidase-related protein [Caldilineales bacterium]